MGLQILKKTAVRKNWYSFQHIPQKQTRAHFSNNTAENCRLIIMCFWASLIWWIKLKYGDLSFRCATPIWPLIFSSLRSKLYEVTSFCLIMFTNSCITIIMCNILWLIVVPSVCITIKIIQIFQDSFKYFTLLLFVLRHLNKLNFWAFILPKICSISKISLPIFVSFLFILL